MAWKKQGGGICRADGSVAPGPMVPAQGQIGSGAESATQFESCPRLGNVCPDCTLYLYL